MKHSTTSLRLPEDVLSDYDRLAALRKRSRSYLITEALRAYARDELAYEERLAESLAQAGRGAFADPAAQAAWDADRIRHAELAPEQAASMEDEIEGDLRAAYNLPASSPGVPDPAHPTLGTCR